MQYLIFILSVCKKKKNHLAPENMKTLAQDTFRFLFNWMKFIWGGERITVQMGPKLWEILFIFIFLINRLSLPSSISEWVFLSFIWCSLSPPNIHIQPYWILRLRDPSFGSQRSITNDDIKVALWAWPSKCRSPKQVIMSGFKISMNKHVCLKSGHWNKRRGAQFKKILRLLTNL